MTMTCSLRSLVLLLSLAALMSGGHVLAADIADEESVKIGYLTKLPKFVEWPFESRSITQAVFNFCVLGNEDINAIAAAFAEQSIKSLQVNVIDTKRHSVLDQCQALYIASSESWRAREVLAATRSLPILTIGNTDGFCQQGGIINLVKQGGKLKFEINGQAAKEAGIRIAAQLMSIAIKVW